jgi:HEAT repeat protein
MSRAVLVGLGLIVIAAVTYMILRPPPRAPARTSTAGSATVQTKTSPSDAVQAPALAVTKPPKNTSQVQTKLTPQPITPPSVEGLSSKLLDDKLPLKERTRAARELVKIGSDEAFAALQKGVSTSSPAVQAAIAESLGQSERPDAKALLASLVQSPNETVALGAVRGLGESGTPQAADLLANLLQDNTKSLSFRTEVAQSLGDTKQPAALDTLTRMVHQTDDPIFVEGILGGISKFPYDKTQSFYETYLQMSQVPAENRAAALDTLQNTAGQAAGNFLLKYLQDQDPDIRQAAARSLVSAEDRGSLAPDIMKAIAQSTDPDVRADLYRALSFQDNVDLNSLWPSVQKETDPGAKVAALSLVAEAVRSSETAEMKSYFNQNVLPQLEQAALQGDDYNVQFSAVAALKAANTPESLKALEEIRQKTTNARLALALGNKGVKQ